MKPEPIKQTGIYAKVLKDSVDEYHLREIPSGTIVELVFDDEFVNGKFTNEKIVIKLAKGSQFPRICLLGADVLEVIV